MVHRTFSAQSDIPLNDIAQSDTDCDHDFIMGILHNVTCKKLT